MMSLEENFKVFVEARLDEVLAELQEVSKDYQRSNDKLCELDEIFKKNLSTELYSKILENEEITNEITNLKMEHCYLRGFSDALKIAIKL